MAARSIASLSLSFGLVSIPVKLYSATESSEGIHFNFLHKCGSRVKQKYICVKENIPVERSEMVKGYEFEKDRYVMFARCRTCRPHGLRRRAARPWSPGM